MMESFGAELKAAREARKITLRQMADDTRIGLRHLENLEAGRFSELPGGMYNRAFLRTYCEYLALEAKEFLAKYDAVTNPPPEKGTRARPISMPGSQTSASPVMIWSALLFFSVVGLFLSRLWIAAVFSPYFTKPAAATDPAKQQAKARALQLAPPPATVTQPTPTEAAPVAETQGASANKAPRVERASKPLRLEFQVQQRTWVSVTSDGNRALFDELQPGDVRVFEATERFYLIIGNAAGIRLKINGRQVKSLGGVGQVVHLTITPRSYGELLDLNNSS